MTIHTDRAKVAQIFQRHGEVITTRDAVACGVPVGCVRRVEDAGTILRLSKSAFVTRESWDATDKWGQFRLRSLAFGLTAAPHVFLTGASAQAIFGLPVFTSPPDLPIAIRTRPTSSGTNFGPHARVRTGVLPTAHRWQQDRVGIVSTSYAAIDVARHSIPAEALAVVDAVLHAGTHRERLDRLLTDLQTYPGIEQAIWAVENGDLRVESPTESLGRLAFLEAGLPAPLSNVWISDGNTTYRVDHLIADSGVVLEADGALKLNNRADAHEQLRRQIVRESWLRSKGFAVERYDMPMGLYRRPAIVRLADRAAKAQRGRPIPTCWSLDPPRQFSVV
ncbi:type IV toxin-antitoxin system AbiEi family antitoxin domain-containing protein [Nakamurella lactea]|uniref:type IV toxin-antitoxin system AbiEi family antitoxin domain-containing protein n=1 Tax=Nakamurella lactea TaxID=459515 RepID=UPI0004207270|nr:type IV toxin-antitoxin system AbiEi family antitoxin domain-containing protein [Nakamurella lactea]